MSDSTARGILSNSLVTAAAFIIVVAGLRAATPVVVPFLFALFVAIIAAPSLFWLRGRGLPEWLALIIVIVGLGSLGMLLMILIGTSFTDFTQSLPQYQAQLQTLLEKLVSTLARIGIEVSATHMSDLFDPGAVMRFANSMLSSFGGLLSNMVLIGIATVFMLLEATGMAVKMRAATRDPEHVLAGFNEFVVSVKSYIVIKTVISFVTGLAVAIFLVIIGLEFPVLWGLLAFLLNYVPNIGWIIAAVPAILLAVVALGPMQALIVFAGYGVINFILGNVIEPRVMGRGVGLSTLVVFASLVFWGWVLGPVGMILSVPLTMMVKIALQSSEETRWIALLLGTEAGALAQAGSVADNSENTA